MTTISATLFTFGKTRRQINNFRYTIFHPVVNSAVK